MGGLTLHAEDLERMLRAMPLGPRLLSLPPGRPDRGGGHFVVTRVHTDGTGRRGSIAHGRVDLLRINNDARGGPVAPGGFDGRLVVGRWRVPLTRRLRARWRMGRSRCGC